MAGEKYLHTRNYHTKSKGAQEAHEAIRPTYMNTHQIEGTAQEKRLYELIWKRTIASQMADAELERTIVTIAISGSEYKLVAEGEVLKFDGFLKVYMESTDEDVDQEGAALLPPLSKGEHLSDLLSVASNKLGIKATSVYNGKGGLIDDIALIR